MFDLSFGAFSLAGCIVFLGEVALTILTGLCSMAGYYLLSLDKKGSPKVDILKPINFMYKLFFSGMVYWNSNHKLRDNWTNKEFTWGKAFHVVWPMLVGFCIDVVLLGLRIAPVAFISLVCVVALLIAVRCITSYLWPRLKSNDDELKDHEARISKIEANSTDIDSSDDLSK